MIKLLPIIAIAGRGPFTPSYTDDPRLLYEDELPSIIWNCLFSFAQEPVDEGMVSTPPV